MATQDDESAEPARQSDRGEHHLGEQDLFRHRHIADVDVCRSRGRDQIVQPAAYPARGGGHEGLRGGERPGDPAGGLGQRVGRDHRVFGGVERRLCSRQLLVAADVAAHRSRLGLIGVLVDRVGG